MMPRLGRSWRTNYHHSRRVGRLAVTKRTSLPQTHADAPRPALEVLPWRPVSRVAFRFAVVYLTLFCLATQISGSMIPNLFFTYRGLGRLWPMRSVTHWVGTAVFGIDVPLDDISGGETIFFWIQTFWVLIVATAATAVWSLLGRRRDQYESWLPWCRLAVRLALAASLFEYGMTKVIPTQFPPPPLTALVTPVGDLTLSALLWTTIGSSPAYEIATGCVELLAALLLLVPRTAVAGAVVGFIALAQVLLLNLTFDIGVKLVTFHLIVLSLIVLAPEARRIANALVGVPVGAASMTRIASSRLGTVLQLAFGAYLLVTLAYINWSFWQVGGGGQPRSPLYGIWNVERMSIDGQSRPSELNDYDRRWRRVVFDTVNSVAFQRTDESFAKYGIAIDRGSNTFSLTKGGSRTWSSRFTFDRAGADKMTIRGEMDGHQIEADLQRVDFAAFPLLNSSFRWVRPHDP